MFFRKKKNKEKRVTDVIYGFDNFDHNRKIGDIVIEDKNGKKLVIYGHHPGLIRIEDLEKKNGTH